MSAESACPGCGLVRPEHDGPTHAYIGASPACWALFGDVLAREFGDAAYFRIHQLTVDAYAAQHPGEPGPRSSRSVALHLATLCLALERGADPQHGPQLHRRLARRGAYPWLEPPRPPGRVTVADVHAAATADEHARRVEAWARDVWAAWGPHHATVRAWVDELLGG